MEKTIDTKSQYLKLALSLLVLLIIIGSFLIYLAWPSITGKTIILDTRPVDPFDLFRGQYMTINYQINTIPLLNGIKDGETVYVTLKEDDKGIWQYESTAMSIPQKKDFIKGTVERVDTSTMRVTYGVEQYFFERGANLPMRGIQVKLKVAADGQARIDKLLQDGKPVKITYENFSWRS